MMTKRILYVSTHLDDAILSCGAGIIQAVKTGHEVLVASIFTSPGNDAEESIQALYDKRKSDDNLAADFLGASLLHLDFVDAPFRDKHYRDFSTILFHHQLPVSQHAVKGTIAIRLQRLLDEFKPEEVWFPLGIGGHIDHHIVFESSKLLWDNPARFNYYEDLPYALLSGWRAIRWQQIKATPVAYHLNPQIQKMSLIEAPLPFVHNYCFSAEDKLASVTQYDKEWNDLKPRMLNAITWQLDGSSFVEHFSPAISMQDFTKKCQAIRYYSTEWPILFGQDESNVNRLLEYATHDNEYRELFWKSKKSLEVCCSKSA